MIKYRVRLNAEERQQLTELVNTGRSAAATLRHARILLKADESEPSSGWNDRRIAEALDTSPATVYRVRQRFVEEGLEAALFRKRPTGRQFRKLDGAQEAQLIALACGAPPDGHCGWTLRLLADRLVEPNLVDSISPECVRTTLKKRAPAVVSPPVGDSPAGQCRLRVRHGRRVGGLRASLRSAPPGGVPG
jgi:transposase